MAILASLTVLEEACLTALGVKPKPALLFPSFK